MHTKNNTKILVSVIIPAFNEARTVGAVVRAARANPLVGEVLVIDDGSSDRTATCAAEAGAEIISLFENTGKGNALDIGVQNAKYDTVVFLDADLRGLTPTMLTKLIKPVMEGRSDMAIALHDRKYYFLNILARHIPMLAGQRALTKKLWRQIPVQYKKNFQTEIALNYFASKNGDKISCIPMRGLRHTVKENKHGFVQGFIERVAMLHDLLRIALRLYVGESLIIFWGRLRVASERNEE